MNPKTGSTARDAADENRPPTSPQESAVNAELEKPEGLDVDELRAMPPALVQILAAMGC